MAWEGPLFKKQTGLYDFFILVVYGGVERERETRARIFRKVRKLKLSLKFSPARRRAIWNDTQIISEV